MLKNRKVMFNVDNTASLEVEYIDETIPLDPDSVLIRNHYSAISTGTELARLAGTEWYFVLPKTPGYCCVGEILKVGANVTKFDVGDKIYCYGNHSEYQVVNIKNTIAIKIGDDIDEQIVPVVRMATIAATAIRTSTIEFGDWVVVMGQGLIGIMAAQLARLQGARVIGVDICNERLGYSMRCGIDFTINSKEENLEERVSKITAGSMASTLIEATGNPILAAESLKLISRSGELILLGSPRGCFEYNLTDVLNPCHLAEYNVTFKGAHEWKYPTVKDKFIKHSIERNTEIILDYAKSGRIEIRKLISHVVRPEEAQEIYKELRANKDKFMGIVFNWTK